jgi:hypothetical protein
MNLRYQQGGKNTSLDLRLVSLVYHLLRRVLRALFFRRDVSQFGPNNFSIVQHEQV